MNLTIKTNIPSLIVTIFNGTFEQVVKDDYLSTATICYFPQKPERENVVSKTYILPEGIYQVRLSLPYYNQGELFTMPVVMDKMVKLDEDKEITFKGVVT